MPRFAVPVQAVLGDTAYKTREHSRFFQECHSIYGPLWLFHWANLHEPDSGRCLCPWFMCDQFPHGAGDCPVGSTPTPHSPLPKFLPGANVCELLKPPGKYFTPQDIEQVSAGCYAEGTGDLQRGHLPPVSCRAWCSTNLWCSSSPTASPPQGCCSHWRGWASSATGQCMVGTGDLSVLGFMVCWKLVPVRHTASVGTRAAGRDVAEEVTGAAG